MKKNLLFLAFFVSALTGLQAQTSWKVDPYHSKVNFTVSHLVISEVDGNFKVMMARSSLTKKILAMLRSVSPLMPPPLTPIMNNAMVT